MINLKFLKKREKGPAGVRFTGKIKFLKKYRRMGPAVSMILRSDIKLNSGYDCIASVDLLIDGHKTIFYECACEYTPFAVKKAFRLLAKKVAYYLSDNRYNKHYYLSNSFQYPDPNSNGVGLGRIRDIFHRSFLLYYSWANLTVLFRLARKAYDDARGYEKKFDSVIVALQEQKENKTVEFVNAD